MKVENGKRDGPSSLSLATTSNALKHKAESITIINLINSSSKDKAGADSIATNKDESAPWTVMEAAWVVLVLAVNCALLLYISVEYMKNKKLDLISEQLGASLEQLRGLQRQELRLRARLDAAAAGLARAREYQDYDAANYTLTL